jgi:hypothetical protein
MTLVTQERFHLATRALLWMLIVGSWASLSRSSAGQELNQLLPTEQARSFLAAHCFACHSGKSPEAALNLESLDWRDVTETGFQQLVRIFDRVAEGEMPPATEVVPSEESRKPFLAELHSQLSEIDRTRVQREGRAMERRLNRYEYENALRDLLNLPWIPIRDMLPEDGELYRFNKAGMALDVSHVQLARYMSAAEYALKQALLVKFERPTRTRKRYYARDEPSLAGNYLPRENGTLPDRLSFPVLDSKAQPDVRRGLVPNTSPETREREAVGRVSSIFSDAGGYSWGQFRVPASGRYTLRFKGYSIWVSGGGIGRWFYEGFGAEKAPVYHLPLWHRPNADEVWPGRRPEPIGVYAQSSGKSRSLGVFDFGVEPTECEIEVTLIANEVMQTDGLRLFRTRVNGTDEQYVNPLATAAGMPGYAIQWMEVDGPLDDPMTDSGYDLLFGDLPLERINKQVKEPNDGSPQIGVVLQVSSPSSPQGMGVPGNAGTLSSASGNGANVGNRAGQVGTPVPANGPPRRGLVGPRLIDVRVEVISHDPRKDAERLLRQFMTRVYRHEVQPAHYDRFLRLFESQHSQGYGFANSMLTTYTAVLASPGFLFLAEPVGHLNDQALATRMALFLWNSVPDSELRRLAEEGKLRSPEVRRQQVERMLADSKSSRFIEAFSDYWLDLRKIDDTSPSTTLYNDYELDEPLKQAALEETRSFVHKLITDDLPARNVVDSDFTYLNERLAEHYGVPDVRGAQMRYVALPSGSVRGGLLTQASVLKVTANGTTTSPVLRGNWIAERILGIRVLPPPSVPAVEPDIRGAVTIRQQLEKHRTDANCASCHAKIDPPGLALEAFDVMGGYRQRYRAFSDTVPATRGIGFNGQAFAFHYALPVDCSGSLSDGSAFQDIRELKSLLLRDERGLARNLTSQLIVYATGAPIGFSDREVVETILDRVAARGFGVRSLIHEIVQSELFLSK